MCPLQSNNLCGNVLQYSNCGGPSPTYTCASSSVKCLGVSQGIFLEYGAGAICSNGACNNYYNGMPCFKQNFSVGSLKEQFNCATSNPYFVMYFGNSIEYQAGCLTSNSIFFAGRVCDPSTQTTCANAAFSCYKDVQLNVATVGVVAATGTYYGSCTSDASCYGLSSSYVCAVTPGGNQCVQPTSNTC